MCTDELYVSWASQDGILEVHCETLLQALQRLDLRQSPCALIHCFECLDWSRAALPLLFSHCVFVLIASTDLLLQNVRLHEQGASHREKQREDFKKKESKKSVQSLFISLS